MRVCVGLSLLVLLGSYLGALHPLGDSLAVFRVWIAGGVAGVGLLALILRVWATGCLAIFLAGVAAWTTLVPELPTTIAYPLPPEIIVYTKNLGAGRADWAALGQDIEDSAADVILLQEVTTETLASLAELLPNHPHLHVCNFSGWSAMAVASRWPLSEPGCTVHRSLAYAVVDAPSGPIWVASIHQVWPYPHEQAALLPDILEAVEAAPARQIIAGDFNMVPWGNSVRQIMDAGGTELISGINTTIEVRGVGLPIDHVLSDGWGIARRRPRFGSDHYGMHSLITWDRR